MKQFFLKTGSKDKSNIFFLIDNKQEVKYVLPYNNTGRGSAW